MLLEELKTTPPIGTGNSYLDPAKEATWMPLSPEDKTALKIVTHDTFLAQAHIMSRRMLTLWEQAENLYLFRVPQYFWDNGQPRAALGMPVVLEHIWSIWPQIMLGFFQDDPPFMSKPRPGTTMDAARAIDNLLTYQLDECNFQVVLGNGLLTGLEYGNGLFKYGWVKQTKKRKKYVPKQPARVVQLQQGMSVTVPPAEDKFEEVEVDEQINHATFEELEPRHYLVDPACRYPNPNIPSSQGGPKWIAHIRYITGEQLRDLRSEPCYKNVPSDKDIARLFAPPKEDVVPNRIEPGPSGLITGINMAAEFMPEVRFAQTTVDPLKQPLKMVEYWTEDRVYVTLQDKAVLRNETHDFGQLPFLGFGVVPIKGSWFAMGLAYLIGPEQRLQQGVINGFLDSFSLDLNGQFVRQRGKNVLSSQIITRPGGVIDVDDDVNKSFKRLDPVSMPVMEVMGVISASDARAQRRTAANELTVQGSVPGDKSSITRTAAGANLFAGASGSRIQGNLIEVISRQVFIPFLEAVRKMIPKYMTPEEIKHVLTEEQDKEYTQSVEPVVNGRVEFSILAAAKLRARSSWLQMLPMISQMLMQEPVLQAIQQAGNKVDWGELIKQSFDAAGLPDYQSLIVKMDKADTARAAANNPGVQQMMAQQAQLQMKAGVDDQSMDRDHMAHLVRDIIKIVLKHETDMKGAEHDAQLHPEEGNGTES